jgi:hypothetical protein
VLGCPASDIPSVMLRRPSLRSRWMRRNITTDIRRGAMMHVSCRPLWHAACRPAGATCPAAAGRRYGRAPAFGFLAGSPPESKGNGKSDRRGRYAAADAFPAPLIARSRCVVGKAVSVVSGRVVVAVSVAGLVEIAPGGKTHGHSIAKTGVLRQTSSVDAGVRCWAFGCCVRVVACPEGVQHA